MSDLINKKIKAIDEFNSALKFLVKTNKNLAKDTKVDELSKKLLLGLGTDEEVVIRAAGPYIDRFEYDVAAGNVDFLFDLNHEETLSGDVNAMEKKEEKDEANQMIGHLSGIIKKNWKNLSNDEKTKMIQRINTMVRKYDEYYVLVNQEKLKAKNVYRSIKSYPENTSRNKIIDELEHEIDDLLPNDDGNYTFIFKMKSRDYLIEQPLEVKASDKALDIIHKFVKEVIMKEIYKDIPNSFNLYLFN